MKHIKRAAALVLAVMLSLCLSLTAFAATETSGTLTVTGKGLTGKTVTAIRMFTANVNDGEEGKVNGFDSYSLEDAWLGFFKDASRIEAVKTAGKITDANPSNQDMKDAAVAYVKSLDDTQLASLAHDAQKWVRDAQNKDSFTALTTCTPYGVNSHRLLVRGTRIPYSEQEMEQAAADQSPKNWFYTLPIQFRHGLIGAAVILAIIILRWLVMLIWHKAQKRR